MQLEDAQIVSIGQSDSECALGIGGTMDDAPAMGMYAAQPKTPGCGTTMKSLNGCVAKPGKVIQGCQ